MIALPTTYNGKKYRSATEAKWHAYFDLIGFDVIHENDAYNVNGRNYLPDFTSSKGAHWDYHDSNKEAKMPWFIEVKGCYNKAKEEFKLMQEFSKATNSMVSIVWGEPSAMAFPTWQKGARISDAVYCHYGFTKKGWSRPYYTHDIELEYYYEEDLECVKRVRCGCRDRRGEFNI